MKILTSHSHQLTRLTVLAALIALFAAVTLILAPSGQAGDVVATVTIESKMVQPGASVSVAVDASVSLELLVAVTMTVS